jgi:hypothetical protein
VTEKVGDGISFDERIGQWGRAAQSPEESQRLKAVVLGQSLVLEVLNRIETKSGFDKSKLLSDAISMLSACFPFGRTDSIARERVIDSNNAKPDGAVNGLLLTLKALRVIHATYPDDRWSAVGTNISNLLLRHSQEVDPEHKRSILAGLVENAPMKTAETAYWGYKYLITEHAFKTSTQSLLIPLANMMARATVETPNIPKKVCFQDILTLAKYNPGFIVGAMRQFTQVLPVYRSAQAESHGRGEYDPVLRVQANGLIQELRWVGVNPKQLVRLS